MNEKSGNGRKESKEPKKTQKRKYRALLMAAGSLLLILGTALEETGSRRQISGFADESLVRGVESGQLLSDNKANTNPAGGTPEEEPSRSGPGKETAYKEEAENKIPTTETSAAKTSVAETPATKTPEDEPENEESGDILVRNREKTGTSEKPPAASSPIERGKQYEIIGDSNAWYRDEKDRLWVRQGTGVYVKPLSTGTYKKGGGIKDVREDGILTFWLSQVDDEGKVLENSKTCREAYFVDGDVPAAEASVSGNSENGVIYAARSAEVSLKVAPDGKSGLKALSYYIREISQEEWNSSIWQLSREDQDSGLRQGWENRISTENSSEKSGKEPVSANEAGRENEGQISDTQEWISVENGSRFIIRKEGIYRIYMRTEDQVGNVSFSESGILCVDQTPPKIEVSGVKNQTANTGEIPVQVECRDDYYKRGSLKITIRGANNGQEPVIRKNQEDQQGASVVYFDFPRRQEYDDIYDLRVEAQDLAGNKTEKTMEFSVNRFGPVYDLSAETKQKLDGYYLAEPADITFSETNKSYAGESEIFCRENGELKQLRRGQDYQVSREGSGDSWKQYQYAIPASYFQKEGIYELLLTPKDQAEKSGAGLPKKQVTFALDQTAPGCRITGIEEGEVYRQEKVTACFQPQDNGAVRTMKIYQNGQLQRELSGQKELREAVKLELTAAEDWQTVQVYLADMAGNEYWSGEIPVFVGTGGPIPGEKSGESLEERKEEEILRLVPGLSRGVRKKEGLLLLMMGFFLFALTAAVCFFPVKKRKS